VRVTITGDTPDGRVTWESEASFPERRTTDAFVGRLWATQRVGWLSAERRKNGPSRELDSEMKELGEKWGIPTELTSYLVLEPGMVANEGPTDVQRRVRQEPALTRRGDVGGIGTVAPQANDGRGGGTSIRPDAVPAAAPVSARERDFEQAKLSAEMRDARSVVAADELAKGSGMRSAAGRTFVMRDGVWVDTRAAKEGARTVKVKAFSKAYFALIDRMPELRDAFALGERVRVTGRAVTIELAVDGIESLDAAALAAVARDW
jgi:hypothetical protein